MWGRVAAVTRLAVAATVIIASGNGYGSGSGSGGGGSGGCSYKIGPCHCGVRIGSCKGYSSAGRSSHGRCSTSGSTKHDIGALASTDSHSLLHSTIGKAKQWCPHLEDCATASAICVSVAVMVLIVTFVVGGGSCGGSKL